MNNSVPTSSQILLDVAMEEYKIASSSREGYMKAYTQTNFYLGLILATFGIGLWKFAWCFLLVPFMILVQFAIVQWNQYHSFLAEVYLGELESKINKYAKDLTSINPKISYFSFYNVLFFQKSLITDKATKVPMIKPTFLLTASLFLINFGILIYSLMQVYIYLNEFKNGTFLISLYFICLFILLISTIYNFMCMPEKIKRILRNILIENCQ